MDEEKALIARMQAGDIAAAEALVERYYDAILRYCLWHTPDGASAEDATQETFLKFFRYATRYRHQGKLIAFLYTIARHTCIDQARKCGRSDLPLEAAPDIAQIDAGFREAQSAAQLRALVAALPEPQREIVLLRFAQDLTLREIAEITELPLRTVQSRLRAALKRLKKIYEKGEDS